MSKNPHANNALHGITLETIVKTLVERLGWEELGRRVAIRCFTHDPSVNSSLKFLRKTPWARAQVEGLYLATLRRAKAAEANPFAPWLPPQRGRSDTEA